ncbi:MAG: GAF domain-containing protein [Anaerolineae bacterium]|nr:GAF domain-containing protein [Anaerolineae bacterium]
MSKNKSTNPTASVNDRANTFQSFIENAADFVATITPDGQVLHINESGRLLLALFDEDKNTSLNYADLVAEADRQHIIENAIPTAINEGFWQGHVTMSSMDGLETPFAQRIISQPVEEGETLTLYILGIDITDRQWIEDSLQESETRFRSSFENTSLGMALISPEGNFLQVNTAMTDLLGYTQQEFMDKSIFDFIHPDEAHQTNLPIQRLQAGELNTIKGQIRYQCKNNAVLWGHVNATAIQDVSGNIPYFLFQIQDITEQKNSEEALKERETLLRLVLDTIPQAVFWKDVDSIYLGSNKNFADDAGLSSPQDIIGKTDFDLPWKPEEAEAYRKDDKRVMDANNAELNIIEPQLQANGQKAWLETNKAPLHNTAGEVIGILGTYEDITDRVKLETQLQETLITQARQLEIGEALTAAQTEQDVLEIIIEKAAHYPNAALSITYWDVDASNEKFDIVVRQSAFKSGIDTLPEGTKTAWNQSALSKHYSKDALFISNNLGDDSRLDKDVRKSFSSMGVNGLAILPMVASGDWLGNMAVMTKEVDFFTEQVVSLYRALAEQGSIALRGTRLFAETQMALKRRSQEVALTIQIAQDIASAPNLTDLYQRVVNQIKEQFNYYHVQLLRYDPFLDTVALIYGYGEIGQKMLDMNHSMPLGVGLIGTAAASGKTTYRGNVKEDADWQSNPLLNKTQSELSVPIKLKDEVLGVLDVQSDWQNGFSENDQLLLEGLCGQIAVAIESTRLREEMDARVSELTTLQRYMSREGWESYRNTKENLLSGYQFDHQGVAALIDELELDSSAHNGSNGEETAVSIRKRETPLAVLGGEIIGKISVEEDDENPLSDDDLEFIQSVSAQVAEALEAARLFEQTQDALSEQERLSTQLETVAQVSTAASTVLEVDALLQAVVDLTKASFGLYHTHIYLIDPESNRLTLRAGADQVGRLMTLEGRQIGLYDESIVARAARNKGGIVENDVRKIVDFLPNPLLPQTRAELAVPLIIGDSVIGVLDLQADQVDFFTEEDLNIHRTLASQIAVAVQNASLFAEQVETSEKLREVDRLKSEFLASMSHELRTPLNSIIGFADVLLEGLDGELNERMEEDVRLIRDSGRHLRELIGDILDMSKIESGRMEMRYEEIDIHQMGHDILANAAPLAEAKNLALHLNISDEVDVIEADRTRLRQVLWNIMGNAIKFTEKGSVTLSVDVEENHLLVGIHDTGIGIEDEHIPIVFEQFRQIDGNLNRSVGGTGLGMPITKKLVELHGGDIWIESVIGQGSTFWFTIPVSQYYRKPKLGAVPLEE